MKKISYSLRIGFIGTKEIIQDIFIETLKITAIESNISTDKYEFLIVFEQIPIKIKIFIAEKIEDLIYNFEKVRKLDVIIILLNLYDSDSFKLVTKDLLKEFNETYSFQGVSILVGMDLQNIYNEHQSINFKISRYQLQKITKELNLIYCFEIFNKNSEIKEIFNKIFNDFILRFQYSSPELFETAKFYGKKLIK